MKRYIGNGLAVIAGQVISAIGSLIGVRIITEYITPTEYGNLTLGLTLALVVNQILLGPLGAGVTRFYSAAIEKKETYEFLIGIIRFLIIILLTVTVITILAVVGLCITDIHGWIMMVVIAAIFSIVSGLNAIINGLWLGNNQQVVLSMNVGLEPWFRIAGGVATVILIENSGQVAFLGYIFGVICLLISQIYLLKRNSVLVGVNTSWYQLCRFHRKSVWQRKTFSYSYPFAIWGIFTTLQVASDRWILQWYHGTEEVGYFALLYQIGFMPMTLLTSMGAQLLTPILFNMAGDGSQQVRVDKVISITDKAVYAALLFMSFATLLSWLLSELVFSLLAAVEYRHFHSYLPLFVIAGGLFGAGQVAALKVQSQNLTQYLLIIKIIVAIIGIVANFLLVPYYGVLGIGISLTIFSSIYLLLIHIKR